MHLRMTTAAYGKGGFSIAGVKGPLASRVGDVFEVPDEVGEQILRWHGDNFARVGKAAGLPDPEQIEDVEAFATALPDDLRAALLAELSEPPEDEPDPAELAAILVAGDPDGARELCAALIEALGDDAPTFGGEPDSEETRLPADEPEAGSSPSPTLAEVLASSRSGALAEELARLGVTTPEHIVERGRDWLIREVKGCGPSKAARLVSAAEDAVGG